MGVVLHGKEDAVLIVLLRNGWIGLFVMEVGEVVSHLLC